MLLEIIGAASKVFEIVSSKKSGGFARSMNADSMTEYTRATRSEPIVMIDHKIIQRPELTDLMATLTTVYAAMYSQAFSIAINQDIGNIRVMKTLERINPKRSKIDAVIGLTTESLTPGSLKLPDYSKLTKAKTVYSMEHSNLPAIITSDSNMSSEENKQTLNTKEKNEIKDKAEVETDAIAKFHQNLAVGILFEVTVQNNGSVLNVPLSVRPITNDLATNNCLSLLNAAVKNRTAKERYREWRSGGLSFWNDIILCRDILREDRKNIIRDETGMVQEILKRKSDNKIAGAISLNPSISTISNILIIDQETANQFERESFKKLKDAKVREQIFKNTSVMILAVVNQNRETVTLYYHDISVPTLVTFRDLKANNRKQSLDPMEVLKSFQMGNGPRL